MITKIANKKKNISDPRKSFDNSQLVNKILQITNLSKSSCSDCDSRDGHIFPSLIHTLLQSYERKRPLAYRTEIQESLRSPMAYQNVSIDNLNTICDKLRRESCMSTEMPLSYFKESPVDHISIDKLDEGISSQPSSRGSKKVSFEEKKRRNRELLLDKLLKMSEEDLVVKGKPKRNLKTFSAQHEDFRGSRYRGVSKNKGKWQMTLTLNNKRLYKGGFRTEIEAAREYDKLSIQNFGLKARANLSYSKAEVISVINEDQES
ncbi:unnamed protein product [Moneuplotes crassus]|uniref:AP2/ERF domain-containing protein n=1 Tax=Euplotes crassus TaxID=5936 RepID=A0AAD1X8F4_EUPCR|nr:unnamed protein product [Moneuplotes crassus]